MDELIRIAAVLAMMSAGESAPPQPSDVLMPPTAAVTPAWPGEDKFRHAAASWAVMSFTYAAARAAGQNGDASLAIALPVTAIVGIGKEIADQRRGGVVSAYDLVADALGAGVAYVFLREVR